MNLNFVPEVSADPNLNLVECVTPCAPSEIHFELGSAPAPGAVWRAPRQTFTVRAPLPNSSFLAVAPLADEASDRTREGARAPLRRGEGEEASL